jgi:hypothetical protein
MQKIIDELTFIVREYHGEMMAIPQSVFYDKPNPLKWSKLEVLGHLIDSAQNNLRRFICAQYESVPPWIVYHQDVWVAANDYQSAIPEDMVQLWRLMNERVIGVLKTMDEKHYTRLVNTGKDTVQYHSVFALAGDYVKHMKHHLNQIMPHHFNT